MVSETQSVNATAVSPADSSMWIATSARGLVRVGRNGKAFCYSVEKGDFSCNNVVALSFDNEGVLWIKDAEGAVYSYTSFSGFVKQTRLPQSVADALSAPVTKEETVVEKPAPEPLQRPWYGSWWMPSLAILFFALFIWQFLKNRRNVTKSPAIPAVQPLADNSVTPHSSETPALAEKPAEICPRPAKTTAPAEKPAEISPRVSDGEFAAKVQEIIKANFTNPDFGVEDVAAALGMSRVHLNRKLKAENSPSPSDIIKKMRMDLAAGMLKEGSASISEIASRCGFSSASYFSSAFKEYFGVAPAAYGK